jgi:hypothetical protein
MPHLPQTLCAHHEGVCLGGAHHNDKALEMPLLRQKKFLQKEIDKQRRIKFKANRFLFRFALFCIGNF